MCIILNREIFRELPLVSLFLSLSREQPPSSLPLIRSVPREGSRGTESLSLVSRAPRYSSVKSGA